MGENAFVQRVLCSLAIRLHLRLLRDQVLRGGAGDRSATRGEGLQHPRHQHPAWRGRCIHGQRLGRGNRHRHGSHGPGGHSQVGVCGSSNGRFYGWSENESASESESSSDSEEKDPEEMILDVKNIADTVLFISSFRRSEVSFTRRPQAASARGSERGFDRAAAAPSLPCLFVQCVMKLFSLIGAYDQSTISMTPVTRCITTITIP